MFDRLRRRRFGQLTLALWVGASACVVYETPGVSVSLQLAAADSAVCNAEGACADHVAVSLTAIELMPCAAAVSNKHESTYASRAPSTQGGSATKGQAKRGARFGALRARTAQALDELGRDWRASVRRWLGEGVAHAAHIEGAPTLWDEAAVVDVGNPASDRLLGVLAPPPDSYCGLRLVLADLEPEVAAAEDHTELEGLVLAAMGTDGNGASWSTSTAASTEVTLELAEPLILDPGVSAALLLQVAPEAPSLESAEWPTEDGARAWLLAIKAAFTLEVELSGAAEDGL